MSYQTHPVRLVGGRLCLDFLNTANWSLEGDVATERLQSRTDLKIWCDKTDLKDKQDWITEGLPSILQFRASLRRIFLTQIDNKAPDLMDLEVINGLLRNMRNEDILISEGTDICLNTTLTLEQRLSLSAATLLSASHDMERLKKCPGNECGWFYLDESKNKRRKWCAMDMCGNREKARRHYKSKTSSKG